MEDYEESIPDSEQDDFEVEEIEYELETETETENETEGGNVDGSEASDQNGTTDGEDLGIGIPPQLLRILQQSGLRLSFTNTAGASGRPSRRRSERSDPPLESATSKPAEEGQKLIYNGAFGSQQRCMQTLRRKKQTLADRLAYRELGIGRFDPLKDPSNVTLGMIPASKPDKIIHYSSRCYSGQFSDDGNFFFSCAQDFKVRLYDTSNPYDWKYYKTAYYPLGQWTITDASLSPDNRYLAYSSIKSDVCLSLTNPGSRSEPWILNLDTSDVGTRSRRHLGFRGGRDFGIWSIRFSGDGRELVAGTSRPSVCVYDIERSCTVIDIPSHKDGQRIGHTEDVNAVCFGDSSSPHILYSGSDDTLIKVWDRRSLGDGRAAGVFMGHTEGLTYVDSKGDGRYVLSNGKDQCMKLWDLRKMMSTDDASRINPGKHTTGFDYRYMGYAPPKFKQHPHDNSVVTYRGHSVMRTLIRCHFSPPGSTDSNYVYSGSENGKVYVYNIDSTLAGIIDVKKGTDRSRPADPVNMSYYTMDSAGDSSQWKTCVRDASWHPCAPIIAATSWNGWGMSTGTCSVHTWNDGLETDEGDPAIGQSVDQRLVPDKSRDQTEAERNAETPAARRSSRLRSQRVHASNDEDDSIW